MADRQTIHAQPRAVVGKKVRFLRREGILPANVFGRGLSSAAVQVDAREFVRTVRAAGVRSMFELQVQGETAPRYVVIRSLSRKGGTGDFIHADFYQVDLRRTIQTNVGLSFTGESPAVRDLAGTLLTMIDFVSVRCLPLDIPESIEVDVSVLNSFDLTLTVGDLAIPENVELLTDVSVPVATVNPPRLRLRGEDEEEEGEEEGGAAPGAGESSGEETEG